MSAERAVIDALREAADDLEAGLRLHIAVVNDHADDDPAANMSRTWIAATRSAARKLREKSDDLARSLAP